MPMIGTRSRVDECGPTGHLVSTDRSSCRPANFRCGLGSVIAEVSLSGGARGVHDDRDAGEADQGAGDVVAVGSVAVCDHAPG